ncbi:MULTISPECIES: VOC family protein [Globicatella]|uniref:VOC family protein n=1 Tax=Globicatella TaxID=13075 RepID=UPI0023F1031F|nr:MULTISPECIES: VOC family protein [Globicatella]MDK7630441.1 VOC family protein [Globicatella sanguinis]WIK66656.1 VOC family protein [Globicatella sanguinis]WKT56061.1 VOC family protein [Globicatella sanguinis]
MKIEHVAIYVNHLDDARDFFVKYFEAKSNELYFNPNTEFSSYFLTFEDGARLELMTRPDMVDTYKGLNRTGLVHMAMSVGSKEKVDALTKELENDGYELIDGPRTTGDGYYESKFIIFEGNQLEITV